MRRFGRTLIAISVFRACAGVLVVVAFDPARPNSSIFCLVIFGLAQASDQIDGWLARNYSHPTTAGYLQDAVSDKLFHIGCLIALSERFEWIGLTLWFVVGRELILLAARVVSPNIEAMLKRYKFQSLVYAALMRIGILVLFAVPLIGMENMYQLMSATGYLTLNVGVAFGVIAALRLVRNPE
jgi:CDP-diacylglycerol--glycerol-3-phosphate 3-phosphatidyltransferase